MRKIFWLIVLLGGYLWVLTSGHDDFFIEKGKSFYETVCHWIDKADSDFQMHKKTKQKKKSRRWE